MGPSFTEVTTGVPPIPPATKQWQTQQNLQKTVRYWIPMHELRYQIAPKISLLSLLSKSQCARQQNSTASFLCFCKSDRVTLTYDRLWYKSKVTFWGCDLYIWQWPKVPSTYVFQAKLAPLYAASCRYVIFLITLRHLPMGLRCVLTLLYRS